MNWSVVCHQSERLLLYQRMQATYVTPLCSNTNVSDWCASLTDELLHYTAWVVSQFGTIYAAVLTEANEIKTKKNNELIYYVNRITSAQQLCIPSKATTKMIAIAHGGGHSGFNKCYKIIVKSWYVKGLVKQLLLYIKHCFQCLVLQIRQHQLYGLLQPIYLLAVSYHIIMLEFILALPTSDKDYNIILLLTDKYTKKVSLPPSKATYSAAEWARVLIDQLDLVD